MVQPSTATNGKMTSVIAAIRDITTEGDTWKLADALAVLIPQGEKQAAFQEIIDKAASEGIAGKLTWNTLRVYRDVSANWPQDKRLPTVSFSAHREILVATNPANDKYPKGQPITLDEKIKMLQQLEKSQGVGKVTVASVRKSIAVRAKKPINTKANPAPTPASAAQTSFASVLADIAAGAPKLIGAIPTTSTAGELDKYTAGFNSALTHIDSLRQKLARKQLAGKQTAKQVPAAVKAAKPGGAVKSAAAPSKKLGDLRGL